MSSDKSALPHSKFFPTRSDTMLPAGSYSGKVVFITGGGTGLGKGMALKFSQLGAKVAIAARLVKCRDAQLIGISRSPINQLRKWDQLIN